MPLTLVNDDETAIAVYPRIYPTVLLEKRVSRELIDVTAHELDSRDEAAHHRASQVWEREEQQHIVEEILNECCR